MCHSLRKRVTYRYAGQASAGRHSTDRQGRVRPGRPSAEAIAGWRRVDSVQITRGEGDMPDKGPGSKSGGKKPKGGAKPGDKKKK
jgi:hypothetical protein